MCRHTTQRPCVVVVDFAETASTPRIFARRRRPGFPLRRRIELEVLNVPHLHAERIELCRKGSEGFENEAQENEPEVAVDRLRSRRVRQRHRADRALEFRSTAMIAKQWLMRCQAAAVLQQIAN